MKKCLTCMALTFVIMPYAAPALTIPCFGTCNPNGGTCPTTGTSLETHHLVRFLFGFLCSFDFCVGRNPHVGRLVVILFGARNANPIPPMPTNHQKL